MEPTQKQPQKRTSSRPLAHYVLIGIVLLAFVAVVLAWVDETGVAEPFLRAISKSLS